MTEYKNADYWAEEAGRLARENAILTKLCQTKDERIEDLQGSVITIKGCYANESLEHGKTLAKAAELEAQVDTLLCDRQAQDITLSEITGERDRYSLLNTTLQKQVETIQACNGRQYTMIQELQEQVTEEKRLYLAMAAHCKQLQAQVDLYERIITDHVDPTDCFEYAFDTANRLIEEKETAIKGDQP